MFKKFWLDTIIGTVFVFAIMGVFANISQFQVFDLFDPVGDALQDMELTDVVFSQMREAQVVDERVLLVNIGQEPRGGIAHMINVINKYDPKVIGFDVLLTSDKDAFMDSLLQEAFAHTKNLVMVTKFIEYNEKTDCYDSLVMSIPKFSQHAAPAFANLVTEAKDQDDLKMNREVHPKECVNDTIHWSFPTRLASYLEPDNVKRYLARNNEKEIINFRGNVMDFGATKFGTMFYALDVNDIYTENFVPDLIKDKIVIMCYLGDYLGDRQSREDKFYTPLNLKYAGRSEPDMYGGVIHANTVTMILNEDYINELDQWQSIALAVVICFINVVFFSWIYRRLSRWYDGLTKVIQLLEVLTLVFVILYILDIFNFKLDLTIAIVAILLCGDLLEVYYGVVKNLFSREGRHQLFKLNKF